MANPESTVVVVSHYNAWPTDQLIRLLDQIRAVPAGAPFSVRVVVNQAEAKPLELPERHAQIPVFYRANTGYNIGAWDHGWRQEPRADFYVFLQEECVIARPNWLRAFLRVARRRQVGMVGEIMAYYNTTWDDINEIAQMGDSDRNTCFFLPQIKQYGIDPGAMADHLQSLVICLRRKTLEAIGGFRIGISKYEAIACEIGISKSVQAVGLKVRQVGLLPFRYIHHPQWDKDRAEAAEPRRILRRIASHYLMLAKFQRLKRARSRRRRGIRPFDDSLRNPLQQNYVDSAPTP